MSFNSVWYSACVECSTERELALALAHCRTVFRKPRGTLTHEPRASVQLAVPAPRAALARGLRRLERGRRIECALTREAEGALG